MQPTCHRAGLIAVSTTLSPRRAAAVPLVLTDAFHASDLLPPKMRIRIREILNQSTTKRLKGYAKSCPQWCRFCRKKDTPQIPNMPPDQALLKGLSPRKGRETIQLINHLPTLFNLYHFSEGCVPLILLTVRKLIWQNYTVFGILLA